MGRPASIIVAKRRVNVTRSLVPTPVPMLNWIEPSFFLTFVGLSCCARSRWLTASSDSASIEPLRISPVRARASQTNSAMFFRVLEERVQARTIEGQRMVSAAELASALALEGVAPACAPGWARASDGVRETGGASEVLFDLASVTKPMTALAVARSGLDRRSPAGGAGGGSARYAEREGAARALPRAPGGPRRPPDALRAAASWRGGGPGSSPARGRECAAPGRGGRAARGGVRPRVQRSRLRAGRGRPGTRDGRRGRRGGGGAPGARPDGVAAVRRYRAGAGRAPRRGAVCADGDGSLAGRCRGRSRPRRERMGAHGRGRLRARGHLRDDRRGAVLRGSGVLDAAVSASTG